MARFKESEYKYAVRRHHRRAKGTTIHSKHMTKRNAKISKRRAELDGNKAYIVKL